MCIPTLHRQNIPSTFLSFCPTKLITKAYRFVTAFFSTVHHHTVHAVTRRVISIKVAEDPQMARMKTYVVNLSKMMMTSVYNNKIAPAFTDLLSKIGDIQQNPEKIEAFTGSIAEAIANEMIKYFTSSLAATSSDVKSLLSFLIYRGDSDDEKKLLTKTLKTKFSTVSDSYINDFVNAITDKTWLKSTSKLSLNLDGSISSIFKDMLVACIQALLDKTITDFLVQANKTLNDIHPLLLNIITTNAEIVGTEISLRLEALITTISPYPAPSTLTIYQQSYDQIVQTIADQIHSIVQASKQDGDITQNFTNQEACDPAIRQMLNPPSGTDQATYQDALEKQIALTHAKRLLAILLPDARKTEHGITTVTPGVMLLAEKLTIPDEVLSLIYSFLHIPDDLFPDGMPDPAQKILDIISSIGKRAVGAIIDDQITHWLAKGLNLGMNVAVPPEYLNMWMVRGAFPAIFPALSVAFAEVTLASCGDTLAKEFKALTDDGNDRNNTLTSIAERLYNGTQDDIGSKSINLEAIGVTKEVFSAQIMPLLNQIADAILTNAQSQKPKTDHVKKWVREISKPEDVQVDKTYGELLLDLIFHVGKLKALDNKKLSEFILENFLMKTMNKAVSSAMNSLRKDDQLVASGILDGLNDKLSTQDEVDHLLFGGSIPVEDQSVNLNKDIAYSAYMVNQLIKKILHLIPKDSNWFTKPFEEGTLKVIESALPSSRDNELAFSRVYSSTLANRYLNENLYLKTVEIALKALEDAARAIALIPA